MACLRLVCIALLSVKIIVRALVYSSKYSSAEGRVHLKSGVGATTDSETPRPLQVWTCNCQRDGQAMR